LKTLRSKLFTNVSWEKPGGKLISSHGDPHPARSRVLEDHPRAGRCSDGRELLEILRSTKQLENGAGDTRLLIYHRSYPLLRPLVARSHQNGLVAALISAEDQSNTQPFQEGNTKTMKILWHPYPR